VNIIGKIKNKQVDCQESIIYKLQYNHILENIKYNIIQYNTIIHISIYCIC